MSPEHQASDILARLAADGVEATRLCADSRQVLAGDIFVAYPGHRADGRRYIVDAVHAGASAVLWEREGYQWNEAVDVPNVPVFGLAHLSGYIADEFYGRPSQALWTVGVTGTNGKTSVTQWLARAYAQLGRRCGLIGTLGIGFPGQLSATLNTTPDALTVHRALADIRDQGGQAVAMEVSSIGLDQARLNGVRIDVAVFTNLTHDHLDVHGSPEAYLALRSQFAKTLANFNVCSYILGIASYNAGPGTVRKWLNQFGSPPKTLEGSINWIESIPFTETRNYVQRVLENVQVYRTFAQPEAPPTLDKDLVR